MKAQETIVAIYNEFESANRAIQDLVNDGISRDDIGLAVNNEEKDGKYTNLETNVDKYEDVSGPEGGTFGAVMGGITGAAVALSAIVIPGVGPILAAGPLVALLGGATGAVVGGALGAVTGGITASLVHLGVADDEASYYAEAIRRGNALITVTARDENQVALVSDILRRHQPINLKRLVDEWRDKGWKGIDAENTQVTNDDLTGNVEPGSASEYYSGSDDVIHRYPYIPPPLR